MVSGVVKLAKRSETADRKTNDRTKH